MITKTDIKYIVSLQLKKQRQKYGQFIVEGEKSIAELLKSRYKVDKVYATTNSIENFGSINKNINICPISDKELQSISVHKTPQGMLAIANIPETKLTNNDLKQKFTLALDNIQDPGNMGTIIRIADWYGIKTIICSQDCTDIYNPKCINSTMGSFTRVNVFYEDILRVSEKFDQPIIATMLNGDNIHSLKSRPSGLIVIGNEGHGISQDIILKAKYKISIPRIGEAESLNAAVSAAIIIDNLTR